MKSLIFLMISIGVYILPCHCYAQKNLEAVEQSSEVFLEEYSDTFQENFFEGLKQKGIRNYDRAITYFLECKKLQPQNTVVSFELAKFHLYDKQIMIAQEYAIEALNGEPENYWYAETLVNIVAARKAVIDELKGKIPWSNTILRRNLSEIYFLNKDYITAQSILKGVKLSKKEERLSMKITDSIAKQKKNLQPEIKTSNLVVSSDLNSFEAYRTKIESLLNSTTQNEMLLETTTEALENFPSQPYFYYANGVVLNREQNYNDAIDALETALDYLIDDAPLQNSIYKELANSYTATNNSSKANMYLSKIKSGF